MTDRHRTDPTDQDPQCSFCGRRKSEVQAMFRSEDARICDRCVREFKTPEDASGPE